MSNISVAEILKIYGKWADSKQFLKFIKERKGITERQAYNLIKKATERHEILKETLRNRTVLYGLAEFGPIQKNEDRNVQSTIQTKGKTCTEESEEDKARAISLMKASEPILGYKFSKKDWEYVLNQNDGKRMLDKAKALIQLRGTEALL